MKKQIKNIYISFFLICLLLLFFAFFKKKNIDLFYQNDYEPFFGDIKDALNSYIIVNSNDYNKLKSTHKEGFSEVNNIDNKKLDELVNTKVRSALNSIPAVRGNPGPQGRPGPSGGLYQNRGSLISVGQIDNKGLPKNVPFAMVPLDSAGNPTPIILGDQNYRASTDWTHHQNGNIYNHITTPRNICMTYNNKSNLGKNNLLELTRNPTLCTSFSTDNHNRLRINGNNNQCITVKKKSDIPIDIPIPANSLFCNADNKDDKGKCLLSNDRYLLGIEKCDVNTNNVNQIFRFM